MAAVYTGPMVDFQDLRLDRPDDPEGAPAPDRRAARLTAAALIVLVLGGAAAYFAWPRRSAEPPPARAQSRAPARTLPVEPPSDVALPPLAETDPLVRQLVSALSRHPTVMAWLATDQLIHNFALVVQAIADHHSPAKHLKAVRPGAPFAVVNRSGTTYIDPASYRRYDTYADAFAAIDARGAARVYATLKPRISEALQDLGDPQGDADGTLKRAIVDLLETPVIETPIPLARPSVMYTFQDPELETLSGAQRHLLRMGPRNVRIIQQKLREIAPYLGIEVPAADR